MESGDSSQVEPSTDARTTREATKEGLAGQKGPRKREGRGGIGTADPVSANGWLANEEVEVDEGGGEPGGKREVNTWAEGREVDMKQADGTVELQRRKRGRRRDGGEDSDGGTREAGVALPRRDPSKGPGGKRGRDGGRDGRRDGGRDGGRKGPSEEAGTGKNQKRSRGFGRHLIRCQNCRDSKTKCCGSFPCTA